MSIEKKVEVEEVVCENGVCPCGNCFKSVAIMMAVFAAIGAVGYGAFLLVSFVTGWTTGWSIAGAIALAFGIDYIGGKLLKWYKGGDK